MTSNRRDFFKQSAALVIAALHSDGLAARRRIPVAPSGALAGPRLLGLALETSADLREMKRFYHEAIGLRVLQESGSRLMIAAGETPLTFKRAPAGDRAPFYHFAFNIPENKIERACAWQRSHGPLLPIPERLRDARYPAEIVNYAHWNAHSVFFLDPGGNVVEYIARHDLPNARPGDFEPRDILYASEIAFIVDDVLATAALLEQRAALNPYRGGDANFMALGDEYGLVLVMKRGRILNFNPASQDKAASVFPTAAIVRGEPGVIKVDHFPYELKLGGAGETDKTPDVSVDLSAG